MNLSFWDVAILIPALPGLLILMTLWLPWETWISDAEKGGEFPRYSLAGYLAYLSFVSWHFKSSLFVTCGLLLLGVFVAFATVWKDHVN
jgi:hypothetical protein